MSRPTRQLARDEIRLQNDEITKIVTGDVWVELESPVEPGTDREITARYEINDIVTDAVNVTALDAEPIEGDLQRVDYEFGDFRENAESGCLLPESVLRNDGSIADLSPSADYRVISESDTGTPDAATIIETISTAVNRYNVDAEELMTAVDDEHNYLQKEMFEAVVKPIVLALATTPQYDARNQHARQQARDIASALDWDLPNDR